MVSLTMRHCWFALTLILNIYSNHSFIIGKTQSLKPSVREANGASVISHFGEVSTSSLDQWEVNIASESSWQFIVILDSTWGFDPDKISGISFTLNSPSVATGSTTFDDLVFGFTADNAEYISTWIPMDNAGQKNRIYPECDLSSSSVQPFGSGDIAGLPNLDRTCDVAGGSCLNWKTMWPKNAQFPNVFETNSFPITFTLENNPSTNTFYLQFETGGFSLNFAQKCNFKAMPSGSGLKVYIGGNDPGQTFTVSSFDLESYSYTSSPTSSPTTAKPTTGSPTSTPSKTPSKAPSMSPTPKPTGFPTKTPTKAPTKMPTATPTGFPSRTPTKTPSSSPTDMPTRTPTRTPTKAPTGFPTKTPTKSPTATPTVPSTSPTKTPTKVPTATPTKTPTNFPTATPTKSPSATPTDIPTAAPSAAPTDIPTAAPTDIPTASPTAAPTDIPTAAPTDIPTASPTAAPTDIPTAAPTDVPSATPTKHPSATPTTAAPTATPTSSSPTTDPTSYPSFEPTIGPTNYPSITPTTIPTEIPSLSPTTAAPTPEICSISKPCELRTTSICCSSSMACQWNIENHSSCSDGTTRSMEVTCCTTTPNPSLSPSISPTLLPSLNPTTQSPSLRSILGVNGDDGDGGNQSAASVSGASTFNDLLIPIVLVSVIGGCALLCVVGVIARQVYYNARKKEKKRKERYDLTPVDTEETPQAAMKELASIKGGRYDARTNSSVDLSGRHSKRRYKGSGGQQTETLNPTERERIDVIDGQSLTIPLKNTRGQRGGGRGQFGSNIAHIASGNNLLMDDIVEEIDEDSTDPYYKPRNKQSGNTPKQHRVAENSMSDSQDIEEEEEEEMSQDGAETDPSVSGSSSRKGTRGRHRRDDSDDTMRDKPDIHNYGINALRSLAPTSMLSEDDQKLAHPPFGEGHPAFHRGGKGGRYGTNSLSESGQFSKLQRAINNAKTNSDFEKLEKIIKSGQIPSDNWHGKGSKYNGGQGGTFQGMVTKAFDPATRLTSAASNLTVDKMSDSELYKPSEDDAFDENLTYNFGGDFKLPNMPSTSQVSIKTNHTENSIGVKMPQYRSSSNRHRSDFKRAAMLRPQSEIEESDNDHQLNSIKKKMDKNSKRDEGSREHRKKSGGGALDKNELLSKLKGVQKADKQNSGKRPQRGRDRKYVRKSNESKKRKSRGGGRHDVDDDHYISEMENEFQ